jgi:hypothetical protein
MKEKKVKKKERKRDVNSLLCKIILSSRFYLNPKNN